MIRMVQQKPPVILVVAGSDPVAGAGLQADLKAITALGGYAATAVTAITVQDSQRVYQVHPLPARQVVDQMRVCLADLPVDAIKLGMLATRETLLAVAEVLRDWPRIPVVADPVLAGTQGGTLLESTGHHPFLEVLLPLLTLLTPNLPEAEILTGLTLRSLAERERAARHLAQGTRAAILIKGGHGQGEQLTDLLWHNGCVRLFTHTRLPGPGFHGTGCTLASAIAVALAQGKEMAEAVEAGIAYMRRAMATSLSLGKGQNLFNPH